MEKLSGLLIEFTFNDHSHSVFIVYFLRLRLKGPEYYEGQLTYLALQF